MAYSKWYKYNSFDQNIEYAEKVLCHFGIEKYNFVTNQYGETALNIEYNCKSYVLEVDSYAKAMLVKRKKITRLGQRNQKIYVKIITSFDKDAIYNSIKFVANDNDLIKKS